MSSDDLRLTQIQIATLRALVEACNFSPKAHPPEEAVLHKFPKHLRGDASTTLDQLRRIGLCQKHPTRGGNTWNITNDGLRLAHKL
jgi:hypothetical protein